MTFQNLREIEDVLGSEAAISARDLYPIWSQRLPVQTAAKKETSTFEGSLRPLEWLQSDLETVTLFTAQALSRQEYLLVCDTYEEAKVYWENEARRKEEGWLKPLARLASHCAEAKTRLGLTRSARSILEPFANNPNLGRREQAYLLLPKGVEIGP